MLESFAYILCHRADDYISWNVFVSNVTRRNLLRFNSRGSSNSSLEVRKGTLLLSGPRIRVGTVGTVGSVEVDAGEEVWVSFILPSL